MNYSVTESIISMSKYFSEADIDAENIVMNCKTPFAYKTSSTIV